MDETCSAKIQVGARHLLDGQVGQYAFFSLTDDLIHPERLNWQPIEPRLRVDLRRDDNYFASQNVALRANPREKGLEFPVTICLCCGSSYNRSRMWWRRRSILSVYSEKKPRDVTLEEANELVRAFFRDHGESRPDLEEYKVKDYPGFQFFQALPDPPDGPIHSAVDLRTGEVWDAPVCRKLTSPSMKKLQNAIRNRIGLTTDEYRKIGRPVPFCEQ